MKKSLLLLGLIAIGFLLLSSSALLAQTTVTTNHSEKNFTIDIEACDGTIITFSAHEQIIINTVFNKNRANYTYHYFAQATGVDAAGNEYRGIENDMGSGSAPLVDDGFTFTYQTNFRIVGKATVPNYWLSYTGKMTVNAKGELTVERFNFSTSCD